jgi:uncharacterized membrane protein
MMTTKADTFVQLYLRRLEDKLRDLPGDRRREIVEEIREHIDEARSALGSGSEAQIRDLLDRMGDPADIAAEARERFGIRPARRSWMEIGALILLPIGGVVVPVVGWIAGVGLLWASGVWTVRDKLLGTLVVPGGLLLPLSLAVFATTAVSCEVSGNGVPGSPVMTCPASPSGLHQALVIGGMALLFLLPVATALYLAVRLRRTTVTAPQPHAQLRT